MRHLIVTESAFGAEAISRALRHVPGCKVIGFVDGRTACDGVVARELPDVVVVDPRGHMATLDRVAEIRRSAPDAKIVLLLADVDRAGVEAALAAGADAVIAKTQRTALGILIQAVVTGTVYNSIPKTSRVQPSGCAEAASGSVPLTTRELEILRLAAAGMSNARIAATLWVTEQTVKFHLSNVYRKLGLANRTQASHYAHVNGLLEADARTHVLAGGAAAATAA